LDGREKMLGEGCGAEKSRARLYDSICLLKELRGFVKRVRKVERLKFKLWIFEKVLEGKSES
jgi:hypothetical protein